MMPNLESQIKKEDSALIVWDIQDTLVSRAFNGKEILGNVNYQRLKHVGL